MRRFLMVLLVLGLALLPAGLRADAPDVSHFTGRTWEHHGSYLTVAASGIVTEYGTPGTPWASPPAEVAQIDAVVGTTAYAHPLNGTDPTDPRTAAPVWLILLPYDMLLVEYPLEQIGTVFCDTSPTSADYTAAPDVPPAPCGI